jgi:hypothetical protein
MQANKSARWQVFLLFILIQIYRKTRVSFCGNVFAGSVLACLPVHTLNELKVAPLLGTWFFLRRY